MMTAAVIERVDAHHRVPVNQRTNQPSDRAAEDIRLMCPTLSADIIV